MPEMNFDGLVGPSHHYGGHAIGNVASAKHKNTLSKPREAALQGLEKMKALFDRGFLQGVLPPHPRPFWPALSQLGYQGKPKDILLQAYASGDLFKCYSSSFMWVANAATIVPSFDSGDGKVHLTPANLQSHFHRSIEAKFSHQLLHKIFSDNPFEVHPPIDATSSLSDEGAANHIRLGPSHHQKCLQIFVYGKEYESSTKFPARQSKNAFEAIAKNHLLDPNYVLFIKQNQKAIEKGVFHNDVISVGNQNFLLTHENAFEDPKAIDMIRDHYQTLFSSDLKVQLVTEKMLSIDEAVKTYLFNSQIISKADGSMLLVAPAQCLDFAKTKTIIDTMISLDGPIAEVLYLDLLQSMKNGGGPACLRLRVILTDEQVKRLSGRVQFSQLLYQELKEIIKKHYREEITLQTLSNLEFAQECEEILKKLESLFELPSLYQAYLSANQ